MHTFTHSQFHVLSLTTKPQLIQTDSTKIIISHPQLYHEPVRPTCKAAIVPQFWQEHKNLSHACFHSCEDDECCFISLPGVENLPRVCHGKSNMYLFVKVAVLTPQMNVYTHE